MPPPLFIVPCLHFSGFAESFEFRPQLNWLEVIDFLNAVYYEKMGITFCIGT